MGELIEIPMPDVTSVDPDMPELQRLMLVGRCFYHLEEGKRLNVILTIDEHSLQEAFTTMFGIRRWRHISVSVQGSLKISMKDREKIGRPRAGGERTPAPLPDWYDLTHLWKHHGAELGFSRLQATWQYLPGDSDPYLNVAEALHLLQPIL